MWHNGLLPRHAMLVAPILFIESAFPPRVDVLMLVDLSPH
jgi:hypothetical protein